MERERETKVAKGARGGGASNGSDLDAPYVSIHFIPPTRFISRIILNIQKRVSELLSFYFLVLNAARLPRPTFFPSLRPSHTTHSSILYVFIVSTYNSWNGHD